MNTPSRRLPIGAEVTSQGRVDFRVWAPAATSVEVALEMVPGVLTMDKLTAEADGYFTGEVAEAEAGTRYRFRLDGGERLYADPASRYQPEGPHGPSEIVEPSRFPWTDDGWTGVSREGQVLYEMHIGTFTPAGTWRAASEELPELARLGVTVLEARCPTPRWAVRTADR